MKKVFDIIKTVILAVLFVLYAAVIIFMSTLVLNRNEFGYTRFGENDWLIITKDNASKEYKKGSLVITKIMLVDELKAGEKVFVYKAIEEDQEVKLVYAKIKEVVNNPSTKYIKLEDGTSWGEEYIAGQAVKCINNVGAIIGALETKWLFFGLLIVPVFFILIIEIYNFIITIKYDEDDDIESEQEENKPQPVEESDKKPIEEKEEIPQEVKEENHVVEEAKSEENKQEEKVVEINQVVEKQEVTVKTETTHDEEVL